MTKTSLTLTLMSLLAGCNGLSTPASQAVTAPSSPCATTGTPVLQGAISLRVNAPRELVSGTTGAVTATAIDNNDNETDVTHEVTWSSSNLLAASAGDGTLWGIGTGDVTIRATLGEVTATADVAIVAITLQRLTLTADTETTHSGALTAWHVTGHYNDGSVVDLTSKAAWTSSDAAIAVVEQPGEIRAMGVGMAMIIATISGQQASAPLMVSNATLTNLRIDAASSSMSSSDTQQLTAIGIYSDGTTGDLTSLVGWYTSDGSLATVTLGRVQAVSSGTVTISAALDNFLGTVDLTLQ